MLDPLSQFAIYAGVAVTVMLGVGFYADHQRRKYHALAEAEREAEQNAPQSGL
jgi:hypothetical protein